MTYLLSLGLVCLIMAIVFFLAVFVIIAILIWQHFGLPGMAVDLAFFALLLFRTTGVILESFKEETGGKQ